MSQFYDQASLVMVPSGYKDGKLYSQKPLSTSGELSFSRGSDIEATRVGSDGLIHKAQVNLFLQSNQFDTTWTNTSSTETSGQAGYDGSNDAWKIDITAAFGQVIQSVSISGVNCASIYVKAGTLGFVRLRFDAATNAIADFNLSNGSVGYSFGIISASSTAIGGGWYRVSMVSNVSSSTFRIYPIVAANDLTATSGNIYVQDAQLNYGLVAQDYVETTTAAVVSGITDNMPRLNYDPANPTCPSLLLEPSRTNAMLHSEYIGSYFLFANASANNNQTTSPEGVTNAASLVPDATSAIHQVASSNISASGAFTFSAFVKAGELNKVAIRESYATGAYASFDLSTGTKIEDNVSGAAFIEAYSNGWYRIGVTYTFSGNIRLGINVLSNSYTTGNPSSGANYWSSNGTDKLYIYGLQCELGASYASSYIPTYGSSATRTADAVSDSTFTALPNANFTIFFEVNEWSGSEGNNYQLRFFDASGSRAIQFRNRPEGWRWLIVNDAGGSAYLNSPSYTFTKMACRYDGTNYQLFADGSAFGVPFAASDTGILDYFDSYPIGVMGIKQMLCFPTALSDADCITLTSL